MRVLAPFDPPGPRSTALHRGAEPQPLEVPDYLVSLGPTVGFKANGAISNLAITPFAVNAMLSELASGRYDVAHIDEPVAPMLGWVAAKRARLPLVGTFHAYSDKPVPNGIANLLGARRVLDRLDVRIAVSEAAAGTGRRWFGGRYRIIPNGVHLHPVSRCARRCHAETIDSASPSSASRSSARACPCWCARSRRCATRCRSSW